jgi:hypothetical protein
MQPDIPDKVSKQVKVYVLDGGYTPVRVSDFGILAGIKIVGRILG